MQISGLQSYGVSRFQLASATIDGLRVLTLRTSTAASCRSPLQGGLVLLVGLGAWCATRVDRFNAFRATQGRDQPALTGHR